MRNKIKQCILRIVAIFFLITGAIDFINVFYIRIMPALRSQIFSKGISIWTPIFPRILPSLVLIITSIILIVIAKKTSKLTAEESSSIHEESKTDHIIKVIEGSAIGLLLIIVSGYHLLNSLCGQLSSYLIMRDVSEFSNSKIGEITVDTLLTNIPIIILYIAEMIIGIWLLVRTKKKYGSDTGSQPLSNVRIRT